jgi:RNA polymerase sigma-70 factor (ECF subfamily)
VLFLPISRAVACECADQTWVARLCALALELMDDVVSLTPRSKGALTTPEGEEMPVDQLAETISRMSVDEYALMDRIATGDPDALETLYYRFHPKLARFLWRIIGRREGLDEIINDIFVDVWRGARSFRAASLVVSSWIFAIAYRKALEYLCQRRSSSAWCSMQHPLERAKDALGGAEIGDALSQGLKAVPLEQRLALLLTYQTGCGLEEIAAITGVCAATVAARVLCARKKLRCLLPDLPGKSAANQEQTLRNP